MTILSTDTCQRANQSGLGTASDGETYTTNGTFTASIASNEATIQGSTGFTSALLGTQTTADINFLVRLTQNNSIFDGIGPQWRSDAAGQNCYFVALYNGTLLFAKLVSGSFSGQFSANVPDSLNTFYWVRVLMVGSHIQARVWADGSGEPGTWSLDGTDTTFSAAGRYGMSFNAFASGSDTVQFDHITVTDGSSTTTSTRTITPVTAALLQTKSRTVGATAALLQTKSRTIPATAALLQTRTRTVPATATLLATRRTIPATATLTSSITPNATLYVRSGKGTLRTRSGKATLIMRED